MLTRTMVSRCYYQMATTSGRALFPARRSADLSYLRTIRPDHHVAFAIDSLQHVGPNYNTDFHDIASGTNYCYDVNGVVNSDCGQTVYFNAVTGYDLVTGWGSPNGQNLINALIAALPLQTAAPTNTGSYTVEGGPPDPTITFTITLYDATPNAAINWTVPACAGTTSGGNNLTSGGSFTLVYNPQYNCNPSGTMYAVAPGYTQSGTVPIGFP
jgi:hypothetical protein